MTTITRNLKALFYLTLLTCIWVSAGHSATPGKRLDAGSMESESTGWTYPLRVYLPAGYEDSAQSYPVLYALDAKIRFDLIADRLDELGAQVIVVAIDTTGDTRREIDFVLPGARAYTEFLIDELIPWTDSRYRTDTTQRTLAGQNMELVPTNNEHVLGYVRLRDGDRLVVFANFSD